MTTIKQRNNMNNYSQQRAKTDEIRRVFNTAMRPDPFNGSERLCKKNWQIRTRSNVQWHITLSFWNFKYTGTSLTNDAEVNQLRVVVLIIRCTEEWLAWNLAALARCQLTQFTHNYKYFCTSNTTAICVPEWSTLASTAAVSNNTWSITFGTASGALSGLPVSQMLRPVLPWAMLVSKKNPYTAPKSSSHCVSMVQMKYVFRFSFTSFCPEG